MKKHLFLILLMGLSFSAFAQTIATTSTGKKVILYENGTWQYADSMSENKEKSAANQAPLSGEPLINTTVEATSSKIDVFSEVSPRLKRFFGEEKSKINCSAQWQNNKGDVLLKFEFLVPVGDGNRYFGYSLEGRTIQLHHADGSATTLTMNKAIAQKFIEKWNVSYFEAACLLNKEQITQLLRQPITKITVDWKKRTEEYEVENKKALQKGLLEVI